MKRSAAQTRLSLDSYRLPLFGLLLLCFAAAILGDSIAEALLLAHFDAAIVPRMYLVNALFLFLFSSFIMPVIDRVDRGRFFLVFSFGHGLMLCLVWAAVRFDVRFVFAPLFSYAYVTKIFLFLLFWTLANDLVDSRRAGKEFPFIAAGGTLGAIGASFAIPSLLRLLPAENLLLAWALLSIALAVAFVPVYRSFGRFFRGAADRQKHRQHPLRSIAKDLSLVGKEPLLRNMAVLYFLLFFVLLNQQYSFYGVLKQRFDGAEDIARFLGYFNGISMGATFLLQVSVAGMVLKKIGSTRSMFLLPAALCIVFGILVWSGNMSTDGLLLFWLVVAGVGLRIAFFDSFFSPNFQIFFSSLPRDVRGRGKLSIEGNIKPFAMALASVWLIAITPRLPFALDMALLLCLSGLMIVQTFRIRRKYTESLTQYLTGYRSRTPSVIVEKVARLNKENFLDYFAELLEREPVEIKVYVVEILARMNMREATDILRSYILKADSRMRAVIVSALTGRTDEELRPLFVKLLLDDDARVVANSVEALAAFNEPEVLEGLTAFLNHSANRVRANVVVALWPYAREPRKHWLIGQLRKMLAVDDAYTASSALYALAELHAPRTAVPELMAFYRQRPDAVRKNKQVWTQFTRALAKNPTDEALEVLLALADNAPRIKRGDLERAFCNALEHGASSAMLVRHMETANSMRRGVLLRALMVHGSAPVHAEETRLLGIARQEVAKVYADWMRFMLLAGRKVTGGVQLLMNALLEECVDERMNNLIYISALLDKSGQIHQIMNRLHHKDRHVRARAIEILDNTGNARVNRWIINLLDSNNPSEHIRDPEIDSQVRTAFTGKDSVSVIRESMSNPNEWVRTCARYALETLEDCLHGS